MTHLTASVQFHELAHGYRAATPDGAQAAYEKLCAYLKQRESASSADRDSAPRFDSQVIDSLESLGYVREIPSSIPQPYSGTIALLETFAQTGMTATRDGNPTPNAALCMRFADELRAARAAPQPVDAAQAVPEGWKMVPIKPTAKMLIAGAESEDKDFGLVIHDCYCAMLDAAPVAQPTDTTKGA